MNTTAPRSTHHTASWLVRVTVALASALAVILGSAAASEAYTVTSRSSVPTAPVIYKVTGQHINIGTPHSAQWVRRVSQSGPVAYRTASGQQHVKVIYTVYKVVNGAWQAQKNYSGTRILAAGTSSVKLPNLVHDDFYAGRFYVRTTVQWTSAIGALQSSFSASMNMAGDYACSTSYTCTTSGGSLYLS